MNIKNICSTNAFLHTCIILIFLTVMAMIMHKNEIYISSQFLIYITWIYTSSLIKLYYYKFSYFFSYYFVFHHHQPEPDCLLPTFSLDLWQGRLKKSCQDNKVHLDGSRMWVYISLKSEWHCDCMNVDSCTNIIFISDRFFIRILHSEWRVLKIYA